MVWFTMWPARQNVPAAPSSLQKLPGARQILPRYNSPPRRLSPLSHGLHGQPPRQVAFHQPTWADLEAAYVLRGRQLVECDLGRRLAVETITGGRSAKSAGRRAISAWEGGVAAQSAEPALW